VNRRRGLAVKSPESHSQLRLSESVDPTVLLHRDKAPLAQWWSGIFQDAYYIARVDFRCRDFQGHAANESLTLFRVGHRMVHYSNMLKKC